MHSTQVINNAAAAGATLYNSTNPYRDLNYHMEDTTFMMQHNMGSGGTIIASSGTAAGGGSGAGSYGMI